MGMLILQSHHILIFDCDFSMNQHVPWVEGKVPVSDKIVG